MLDRVRGKVIERSPTRVVIESGGLGFAVDIPLSTYERLPTNGEVTLLCSLCVGPQGLGVRLFGFATSAERALFRMLLSVSGVGPAMALSVLSGSPLRQIAAAIRDEDESFLKQIKGVGQKTARRIIVELKERVDELGTEAGVVHPRDRVLADVVAALVSLGRTRSEAERIATAARKAHPDASVEVVLRESLKRR